MKTQNISIAIGVLTALLPLNAVHAAFPGTGLIDVGGVAATSSAPVSGVVGSGATRGSSTRSSFAPETQAKVDAVGASLSAASLEGTDPAAAQALIDVINSPAGSSSPALGTLLIALGGGSPAEALATSLLGLRSGNGSIDAAVLSGAVNAYNSYLNALISSGNVVGQKPVTELDSYIQGLPPGQKAVQMLLTKLLAG
jgi:hypothetical protein